MKMINMKIDGISVSVEENTSLLDAAKKIGKEIPTLCFNDKITHNTSCFVCVVKDLKSGRFLPSCAARVAPDMEIDTESKEVLDMRRTCLDLLLSEHSGDCEAPCTISCPAHAAVEEYVRLGKEGKHLEGLKVIKERIPLPISIGRVCPRFCEKDCRRNVEDAPVAINEFKRTAADLHYGEYLEERKPLNGKKVAIIGAGPAGLSVAYFLRLEGVASDIYDMNPEPGGMLRYGIPEYRLPKKTLDFEIAHFTKMGGIDFHFSKKLGKDIELKDLEEKYDAVAICIGSWKSSSAQVKGEEFSEGGIQWLEKIAKNGWNGENPGKVIVIGGGNTAMDCLRTSVRLGSPSVHCFYRRTEKEMPAEKIEIHEAKEEGVQFHFLVAPVSLREENGKKILTCQKMELGAPDASGRRRPVPVEGSDFDTEADLVIGAIGQKTDAPEGIPVNKWGDVAVNEKNCFVTGKVFSAGDCVSGPATVVEAVAGARRTALSILSFFEEKEYSEPYLINVSRGHWNHLKKDDLVFVGDPEKYDRRELNFIPIEERISTFKEVTHSFTVEQLAEEGKRCYECSCTDKHDCKLKSYSETLLASPKTIEGEKIPVKYDARHPEIIMDPGKCIKCGTCVKLSKEVVNNQILTFLNRGFDTTLGTGLKAELQAPMEELMLYVENCPTGALDLKKKQ
jgi:NADPH-dependent glutamate synthase beta subunit-like oxidoreductase